MIKVSVPKGNNIVSCKVSFLHCYSMLTIRIMIHHPGKTSNLSDLNYFVLFYFPVFFAVHNDWE